MSAFSAFVTAADAIARDRVAHESRLSAASSSPSRWRLRIAALALCSVCSPLNASTDDPLGNWFQDPFVQVRHALPGCPTPLGPLLHQSEMRGEEHSRVERGTSCWLAGKCEKPNAYFYDGEIAEALVRRFSEIPDFATSTLWITVKRRFVWIEGCTSDDAAEVALEALAKSIPHVELVLVNVRSDPNKKPPYTTLEAQ